MSVHGKSIRSPRLPGARRFAAERRARAEGIEVADDLLLKIGKLALR